MIKKLICIEYPVGCLLSANIKDSMVIKVSGHKCPKGEEYAQSEIENPVRMVDLLGDSQAFGTHGAMTYW